MGSGGMEMSTGAGIARHTVLVGVAAVVATGVLGYVISRVLVGPLRRKFNATAWGPEEEKGTMGKLVDLGAYLRDCVLRVLSDSSWIAEHGKDAAEGASRLETRVSIIDACESYCAAKAISSDYRGPALLLYGAAVNALITGGDTELAKQVRSAKAKIKEAGLWKASPDIQATVTAATDKARFQRVGRFMREEFTQGMIRAGGDKVEARKLAKQIVDATHDVRHRGRVDDRESVLLGMDGEGLKRVDEDQRRTTPQPWFKGAVKMLISVPESQYFPLLSAARVGCANAIASRIPGPKGESGTAAHR